MNTTTSLTSTLEMSSWPKAVLAHVVYGAILGAISGNGAMRT